MTRDQVCRCTRCIGGMNVASGVLRQERHRQKRQANESRQGFLGLMDANVCPCREDEMEAHARIGKVTQRHVEARQNHRHRKQLDGRKDRYEIAGIAKVAERLANPVPLRDVHDGGCQIKQGQQRRADPINVVFHCELLLGSVYGFDMN